MAQSPFRKRPARGASVLWVTLGAAAGVAVGMLIADRFGGLDGLLRRGRQRAPGDDGWRGDERPSDAFDDLSDDDSELAAESIAHMHVRRRGDDDGAQPESLPDRHSTRERLRDRMRDRRTRSVEPELAADAAGSGHGSRAPQVHGLADVAHRGPDGPSHEALESRVLEVFRNDPVLEARAIDIGAVGVGTIELTGWVDSTGEIAHALTIARGVPDVLAVIDHLAVRGPGGLQSHRSAQYETPQRG